MVEMMVPGSIKASEIEGEYLIRKDVGLPSKTI